METAKTYDELIAQIEKLKSEVNDAHDIIDAIKRGEVDAFIVKKEDSHELYTLRSADKAYRIFIEQMTEGAVTISRENIILYSNSSFALMVNTALENVIGMEFDQFIPEAYKSLISKQIRKAWVKEESQAEIVLNHPGNKPLPLLISMNKLEIDGGVALSIIATDLSLQKETQEQKRILEKKDEFISIVSHELKTPVTSIKGYIQLLQHDFEKDGNNYAADMLKRVDLQINKLTSLISDLLDVKKIEHGELQFHEEVFDIDLLVKEVIEETQRVLSRHPIKYDVNETVMLYGDRNKIGQVITNLLDNAGKYSPAGTEICVELKRNGDRIKLSVQDFGIGIPQHEQSKIFNRFFRATNKKRSTFAGLGLGLYISSEIVKRHKGEINVISEEGNGALFYFELPIGANNM